MNDAQEHEVIIDNYQFLANGTSDPLTIPVGDCVVWCNKDPISHTVTPDVDGEFPGMTLTLNAGWWSGPVKFSKEGTFHYHCAFHPSMKGTIIVVTK